VADGDVLNAGDGDDVAERGGVGVGTLEAIVGKELGDLDRRQRAISAGDVDLLAVAQGAVEDAANGEAAEVVGVVEVGDEHLQVALGRTGRDRNGRNDEVEERHQVRAGLGEVHRGGAELAVGVDDGKVEDGLVRVKVDEEVVDLVEDLLRARVG